MNTNNILPTAPMDFSSLLSALARSGVPLNPNSIFLTTGPPIEQAQQSFPLLPSYAIPQSQMLPPTSIFSSVIAQSPMDNSSTPSSSCSLDQPPPSKRAHYRSLKDSEVPPGLPEEWTEKSVKNLSAPVKSVAIVLLLKRLTEKIGESEESEGLKDRELEKLRRQLEKTKRETIENNYDFDFTRELMEEKLDRLSKKKDALLRDFNTMGVIANRRCDRIRVLLSKKRWLIKKNNDLKVEMKNMKKRLTEKEGEVENMKKETDEKIKKAEEERDEWRRVEEEGNGKITILESQLEKEADDAVKQVMANMMDSFEMEELREKELKAIRNELADHYNPQISALEDTIRDLRSTLEQNESFLENARKKEQETKKKMEEIQSRLVTEKNKKDDKPDRLDSINERMREALNETMEENIALRKLCDVRFLRNLVDSGESDEDDEEEEEEDDQNSSAPATYNYTEITYLGYVPIRFEGSDKDVMRWGATVKWDDSSIAWENLNLHNKDNHPFLKEYLMNAYVKGIKIPKGVINRLKKDKVPIGKWKRAASNKKMMEKQKNLIEDDIEEEME